LRGYNNNNNNNNNNKGKGKFVPVPFLTEHQAMKAYWRTGGIAPRII
jgi:hypothetical protein